MGTVWRLQTRTDSNDGKKISTYCREKSIAAVGWSINDDQIKKYNAEAFDKIQSIRASIKSKDIYYKVLEEYNLFNIKAGKKIVAVETLERVKPGDYIWMRDNGIYYLGYVGNNLRYVYNPSIDALEHDAANQIEDVEWKPIGDESQVPGVIATAFIQGRTLQRVRKDYMYEYASFIYNGKPLAVNIESNASLKQLFYNCLSPSDCEDLVCLYLYDKANYIAIPSTELIKDQPNKEVYLFSSEDKVVVETYIDNIHIISSDELYSWAKEKIEKNSFLIPEGIVKWYKLIHSSEK